MPPDCLNRRFGPGPPIFGLPQSAVRTKGYTSPLIGLPQSAVRTKGLLTSPLIGLPPSAAWTLGLLIFSSLALTAQSHHHRVISSCMHCITPLLTVLHFCQHFIAASMPTIIWHVAHTILTLMWHCPYMSAHIPTLSNSLSIFGGYLLLFSFVISNVFSTTKLSATTAPLSHSSPLSLSSSTASFNPRTQGVYKKGWVGGNFLP